MRSSFVLCAALCLACGRQGYEPTDAVGVTAGAVYVSEDGHVVQADDFAITPTDEGFAIGWAEYPPGSAIARVMVARTDHAGALLAAPRVAVASELTPVVAEISIHPRPDGGLDVIFLKSLEICIARLDSVATVMSLHEWDAGGAMIDARFVPFPGGYAALFRRTVSDAYQAHFQLLTPAGEPIGIPLQIDPTTTNQYGVEGVFDGERFLVVFRETAGADRIRFVRISVDGTLLEPASTVLDEGGTQVEPLIAWSGETALVGFIQSSIVRVIGVGADGTPWPAAIDMIRNPRRESPGFTLAARDRVGVVAAEYDRETVHSQAAFTSIHAMDPSAVPTPPVEVSDPDWSYRRPRVAAGTESWGILYKGDVDGSRRLLLSMVHP